MRRAGGGGHLPSTGSLRRRSCRYLTYSRAAAVGAVVAVLTVIALSRHRWLAALHTLVAAAGSAVVIATIRANPQIAEAFAATGGRDRLRSPPPSRSPVARSRPI